jgi:hypothetical protein
MSPRIKAWRTHDLVLERAVLLSSSPFRIVCFRAARIARRTREGGMSSRAFDRLEHNLRAWLLGRPPAPTNAERTPRP